MTKLLILDKDGTLTRPKSGGVFPQSPEDQELIPGVKEAIARYAADGWVMAIASNQGGCAVQSGSAIDFPVGAYYVNGTDKPIKVVGKTVHSDGADKVTGITLRLAQERSNGKDYLWFGLEAIVRSQWKTVEMAIAEMRYCLKLLPPISTAYFCPDDGWWCHLVRQPDFHHMISAGHDECYRYEFRKPGAGMLWLAIDSFRPVTQALFVGDRPEDEQAAAAANIPFMWAADWVNSTCEATND